MARFAGPPAGREGDPSATPCSPIFCQQRASCVTFAPSEVWSCFIWTHCLRHCLRVLTQQLATWSRHRAPLCMNCRQAPKHLERQTKSILE